MSRVYRENDAPCSTDASADARARRCGRRSDGATMGSFLRRGCGDEEAAVPGLEDAQGGAAAPLVHPARGWMLPAAAATGSATPWNLVDRILAGHPDGYWRMWAIRLIEIGVGLHLARLSALGIHVEPDPTSLVRETRELLCRTGQGATAVEQHWSSITAEVRRRLPVDAAEELVLLMTIGARERGSILAIVDAALDLASSAGHRRNL